MTHIQLYRFGEFILSVGERTLRRGEENVSLTPKMYELLLVLVENQSRILEKEFLPQTVWPDSFVEEGNITFNIRQLRIALGDDAQEPRYIETIPRRGYRFITKVVDAGSDTTIEPIDDDGPDSQLPLRWLTSRPILAAVAFVLLLAVMGSVVWYSRSSGVQGAPILSAPFTSEKLSTDGLVFHAVISPDGKTMVYTHRNGANQSLWIRQLETSNNIQIIPPSESFYGGLAISPDGNMVYFTRGLTPRRIRQFDVYRMPIVGGVPQKLVEVTQGWISVSPDGSKLSYDRCYYNDDDYCSLWIADAADGKNERKLVSSPKPFRIGDNRISPDGRKVAFAVGQSRTASNEFSLRDVDIQTGEERDLTPERFFNINYVVWLPDQSGWLMTARKIPDKSYRIWRVSAATGEASILTSDSETYNRLSLDARGRLLVATRIDPDFSLDVYQTENVDAGRKSLTNAASVSFAPNGKIVYSSIMTGDAEVWISNVDGTDQRQLTNDPADDAAPIVSPDNRFIFFESNRTGKIHVWRMDIDGTNQTQVTTDEGGYPLTISPDGQWIYYRSGLHNSLRRVSLQDGREELVYNSTNDDFALSPDGSRIVLSQETNGEDSFNIVSLVNGKTETTLRSPDPARHPVYVVWSHDGKFLAYVLEDDAHENRSLWFHDVSGSKPRHIADLNAGEISELAGLALAYDSKTFAAVQGTWNHNALLIKGLKP
ncbi:MAG: winged helix-turn-helix domain-containing protein [Acidobacteriota bacterium]